MSRVMSRRHFLGLGVSVAVLGPILAACGGSASAPSSSSTTKPTEAAGAAAKPTEAAKPTAAAAVEPTKAAAGGTQVTLRFMRFAGDVWKHDTVYVDKFMQENPNIIVKGEDVVYDEMFKKCLALGATNTLGDVFAGHNIWAPYLAFKGLSMDLEPMIEAHKADVALDDFFPSVLADARNIGTDGKLYWLPTCVHPGGNAIVIFNKTLTDKAGVKLPTSKDWTIKEWEEIIRATADKANGIYGADLVLWHPLYTQQYTRSWGSDPAKGSEDAWLLSRDGKKHQLGSEPVKTGLEWWWKLIKDGMAPTSGDKTAYQGTGMDHFTAGKQVSGGYTVGAPTGLREKVGDKFEMYSVLWPKGPTGHRGSCLSYNTQSAWAKTKNPEEAFKLVNYLTNKDIAFYMGFDGLLHCGARHSAWFNPKLWERFPVMKDAAEWFDSGIDPFPQPWNLRFVEWQDAFQQETMAYLDAKEDWAQMFEHTQSKCQSIIDLARP